MHIKAVFSYFIFHLFLTGLVAQTTFEKTYFYSSSSADNALNSGYIQTCGTMENPMLVITDAEGDFITAKTYRFSESALFNHVQATSNGNYLLSGTINSGASLTTAFVFNMDATGQVLWSGFQANTGHNRGLWAERTIDGGVVSCGLADGINLNSKAFLAKYNGTGTREWSKTYSWSGNDKITCVKELQGGGYVVCGIVALEPSGVLMGEPKGKLLLMKTDASGNPLWTKIINVINHEGSDTKGILGEILVNSQGIYASGYVTDELVTEGVMVFCDLNGNNINIGTYSSSGFCAISGLGSLTDDGAGNLVTIGGGYDNGCNFFDIYKLQSDLNILWSKRYQGLTACWTMSGPRTIDKAPDGGFVISSGTLLKVDANGEINCATWQPLQKNPCTWTEPAYPLLQGTMLSVPAPAFSVSDTIITAQIRCNDTTYGISGCEIEVAATVSSTQLCAGECTQVSATVTGNPAQASFQWTFTGAQPGQSGAEDPGPVCFDNPGNYQAVLHAMAGCADTTISIPIQVTGFDPVLNDYSGCSGEIHQLDAGNWPGAQYLWSTGSQTQQISVTVSGYYSVTVSSGDCAGTSGAMVTLASPPSLDLPSQLTVCTGEMVQIQAGDGANQYIWSDGTQGAILSTPYDGTYYVTATNACGQEADSIEIIISANCNQGDLFIPNSFAPNGDGLNDFFMAQGENITTFSMQIFDRWGELLYNATDINRGWDGTYQGKECVDNAYVYRITYSIGAEAKKSRMGKVMLIR